jgi:hypothetical protein
MQFLETQGFLDYLERCNSAEETVNNLLDKLQDTTGRGQNPMTIFPSQAADPEIITIADPEAESSGISYSCLLFMTHRLHVFIAMFNSSSSTQYQEYAT